jgi:hypothetical protein
MTRRITTLAVLIAFISLLAFTFATCHGRIREYMAASAQPVAILPITTHDFGRVPAGQALVAHFPLKNDGRRRLIVRQRTSSCECVSGDQETVVLQPGESSEITATLDTETLNGGYQMELSFTTSAPNLPSFKLTLLADVRRPPRVAELAE